MLDYDYTKNHFRLVVAVGLSRQKDLDADPKRIQEIEFVGLLKKLDDNDNAADASNDQSLFVWTIKFFSSKCKGITKDC